MSVCLRYFMPRRTCLLVFYTGCTAYENQIVICDIGCCTIATGLPSVTNAAFYDGTNPLMSGQASFVSSSSQFMVTSITQFIRPVISLNPLLSRTKSPIVTKSLTHQRPLPLANSPSIWIPTLLPILLILFSPQATSIPFGTHQPNHCSIPFQPQSPHHRKPQLICTVLRC